MWSIQCISVVTHPSQAPADALQMRTLVKCPSMSQIVERMVVV